MTNATPVKIEPGSPQHLRVQWNTLEEFEIPYFELRFECPCAGCVDEHTGQRTLRREQLPKDVRPVEVRPIGRYAISVRWSDGHQTGMYGFDRLYDLCRKHGHAHKGDH
jgi:DUF971 family protein